MAHELDLSRGNAAIAFRGDVPWHGLGATILPEDSIDDIRIKAELDYDVNRAVVQYATDRPFLVPGNDPPLPDRMVKKDSMVLYRSDTGAPLSIVSDRYQVVQPRQILDFYRDLVGQYGFEIEVVGALYGGKKVWALANTKNAFQLRDRDEVKGYLLLATSYDGTMATQARFTSVRVVCNNTLTWADSQGKADVIVPHSTKFDADKVKLDLKVGPAWESFSKNAQMMSTRVISRDETLKLFLDAYYGLATTEQIREFQADEKSAKTAEKFIERMTKALFESPGAQMSSARGTLWGALQAVTYDIDHQVPSRTSESRLNKAWFGAGNTIKQRAYQRAVQMVA